MPPRPKQVLGRVNNKHSTSKDDNLDGQNDNLCCQTRRSNAKRLKGVDIIAWEKRSNAYMILAQSLVENEPLREAMSSWNMVTSYEILRYLVWLYAILFFAPVSYLKVQSNILDLLFFDSTLIHNNFIFLKYSRQKWKKKQQLKHVRIGGQFFFNLI